MNRSNSLSLHKHIMNMSKVKYYICLLGVMFLVLDCNAQNFTYQKVDNIYGVFMNPDLDAKNIIDYLPEDYVKDGSVDYTEYIQKAIDENSDIAFPDFPLLINDNGIMLKSNSNIFFDRNSSLRLKPTGKDTYSLIRIYNVRNVNIYNPTLVGDRKNHKGSTGEWGMGIRIQDSENVRIYNVDIKDMWGDGIYITSYREEKSNNILIKNGWIDNARRNGISIISGKNITVDSVQISNTNGTPPAAGIDVEPNRITDVIHNLKLTNILTSNSQRDGIILDFTNLVHAQTSNEVTVHVNNHEDRGSRYALRFAALRKAEQNHKALEGKIIVENTKWNPRMSVPFRIGEKSEQLPEVTLKNIQTSLIGQDEIDDQVKSIIKSRRQFQFN